MQNQKEILGDEQPSEDKISVISGENLSSNENQKKGSKNKEEILGDEKPSAWNICHVFTVLIVCVIFLSLFSSSLGQILFSTNQTGMNSILS